MKENSTHRCHSYIRRVAAACLSLLIFVNLNSLAQTNLPGVAPVMIPSGGFGIDGDALANFPTPGTYANAGDWFSDAAFPGSGGTVFDMTTADAFDFIPALVSPVIMAKHYNDPYTGTDPTTFTSSNKINDNPNTYLWGPGNSPPKNEINNATVYFTFGNPAMGGDADDLWAVISGDRATTEGSSYIDFEFLQKPLYATGTTSGGFTSEGLDGGRTEGDILVTLEFVNGGTNAIVVINMWTQTGPGSYEYIPVDNALLSGLIYSTANLVEVVAPWQPFGNSSYEINQFAEAAVNISGIFNLDENPCGYISTVFVRTRSSGNSSQSELKDLPGPPFQVNIDLGDLVVNCPDDVNLPACSSLADITLAYNTWKSGFTATGSHNPVTNISQIPTLPENITCGGTISFTFSVTDDCTPEAVTCSSDFTVGADTDESEFLDVPADITVSCVGDIPEMVELTWTDNCDGRGTVSGSDTRFDGNGCGGTITRTWTITDDCGNTATATQTITVDDEIAPVLAAEPVDATYSCIDDVPAPGMLAWTDNCDGEGEVLGVDESDGLTCPEIITRTWTYTDACGNVATATQTITVNDEIDPVFYVVPDDATYSCIDDVPAPGMLAWTDNCDGEGEVEGVDESDGLSCPETITRTWTYTDACGNVATATQTITVNDEIAPVFAAEPVDATYSCTDDVPAPGMLAWTDNCDGEGEVLGVDESDGLSCPETITRTWTYTDACGNVATATQTITVNDEIDPVFYVVPDDATYSCTDDVPAPGMLAWTDNCDGEGEVLGVDESDGLSCPETITRTWTYTDACGNVATATQTITVNDEIDPVFYVVPDDATYSCIDDVPAPGMLAWTDNCDGEGEVEGVDESDGLTCPETITRTWTYTDACGNTATATQIITVDDEIAPVFAAEPVDATYSCTDDVPAPGMLAWTDNCDGEGEVLGVDDSDGLSCPETITRTWTYTDACGNVATATQTITVNDEIDPVFYVVPDNATYSCIDDVPAPGMLTWTDNCDGEGTVLGVDRSDGKTCPETITRMWTYTDACGNVATATQIITVDDELAPVFAQAPANATYSCIDDVPDPGMLAWTDNCDGKGTVLGVDHSDGKTCPETITRTWTYTDACGNVATATQIITVDDEIAPVFAQAPANATYSCIDDVPAPGMLAWTDNCDGEGTVLGVDHSDGKTCPETITRCWTYTDACGNVAMAKQIITVDDNIAPVFAKPPANATYSCISEVPPPGMLAWTDNCDGSGEVLGVCKSDGNTCPMTITRTWTYTDACGNCASVKQIITVDDNIPPVLCTKLVDLQFACAEDVVLPNPEFTDNCSKMLTEGCYIAGTNQPCDDYVFPVGTTKVCFWAKDACGNKTTVGINVIVLSCEEPYCTLTQGFYCNPGGMYCGEIKTIDLLNSLLITNLVIGQGDRTFTIPAGGSQCVIDLLPGGGTPEIIPTGGKGCSNTEGMLTNKGRLKNSLLAQTITLGLNLRLDTDLGDLQLTSPTFYTVASSDCNDPEAYPVAGDTLWYTGDKAMPESVMEALGGKPTVNEIFNLANMALGGVATGVPLGDITIAVCIINEAFDECLFIYFITEPVTGIESPDLVNFIVAPNPFIDRTEISFTLKKNSRVNLSVYNMLGAKVAEIFEGNCEAGTNYTHGFRFDDVATQSLIIVLGTNSGFYSHKIIKTH